MSKGLFTNQSTFKRAYAKIIHNVLRRHKFTKISFMFCTLIETLQMIYLALHPRMVYNNNIPHIKEVSNLLSYLHSDRYLDFPELFIFLGVTYFICGALFALFFRLTKVISRNSYWGEYELMDELGLEIINLFMLIIKTFLFVPWLFSLFYSLKVLGNFPIYISIPIFLCSLSALSLVITFTFMCTSHFVYRNPFIDNYMAGPKNRNQELKIIARFMLICYLTADPLLDNSTVFLYYSLGLNLFLLYRSYFFESYFDKLLDEVCLIMFFAVPYVQILVLINMYAQVDAVSLFLFGTLLGILLGTMMILNRKYRQDGYIYTQTRFRRQSVLLNYIYGLIEAIKRKQEQAFFVRLTGTIQYHVLLCEAADCRCRKALESLKSENFEEFAVYNFLSHMLYSYVDNNEFNDRVALLAGYISNWKEQIVSKSLFYLDNAIKNIPPIPELCTETCVYRQMLMIEDSMKKNDVKSIKNLDFNKFYTFQKKLSQLEALIEANVQLTRRFWQEIRFDVKNVKLIRSLGSRIIKQRETIERDYCQLQNCNLYKEKIEVYLIFVLFIIATDSSEKLRKHMEKNAPTRVLKQYFNEEFRRDHLAEKSIVVISGNLDNAFASILYSNRCTTNLYGYYAKELLGKPIGILMPAVIAEHHNQVVDRYLLKQKAVRKRDGFTVSVVDKEGHLQPSLLVQKILPKLDRGIEIVGFLNLIKEDPKFKVNYFLYRGDTEEIIAVSKDLKMKYGVTTGRKLWQVFANWESTTFIQQQMRTKEGYLTNFKDQIQLVKAADPLLLRMRQELYYFKVHLRLVAIYQAVTTDSVYNRSKLTEALIVSAKSNLVGGTDESQRPESGRTETLKTVTFVLMVCMAAAGGLLMAYRWISAFSVESYLLTVDNIANVSSAVSQSTYYLRQLELIDKDEFLRAEVNGQDLVYKLGECQQTLGKLIYDYLALIQRLQIGKSLPMVSIMTLDSNYQASFVDALQNYMSRMYTLLQSQKEFEFRPDFSEVVVSPTFYKTFAIVMNSLQQLLPVSITAYEKVVESLVDELGKFKFWIVDGCAMGLCLLLVVAVGLSVKSVKDYLDQAIEIFSYVAEEEVALILNNASYFLDYYFPKQVKDQGLLETTGEDALLASPANQNTDNEQENNLDSKDNSAYFRKLPIYIAIFALLGIGLFAVLGWVHALTQRDATNTINIIKSLHTRTTLLSYLRTYSLDTTIFAGAYNAEGNKLLDKGFENMRTLTKLVADSNIDQFKSLFNKINSENVCQLQKKQPVLNLNIQNCQKRGNGVFLRGSSSAISSYFESMRVTFAASNYTSSYFSQLVHVSNDEILLSMDQITKSLIELIQKSQLRDLSERLNVYTMVVGVSFVIWLLLSIVALWVPMLKFLESESCWSKNFLTLIPSQAIASSQYLKAYSSAAQNRL